MISARLSHATGGVTWFDKNWITPLFVCAMGDVHMRILAQALPAEVSTAGDVLQRSANGDREGLFYAELPIERYDMSAISKSATVAGYRSTVPQAYADLAICGVCSGDLRDQQQEIILQRGVDWEPLVRSGVFNDDHIRDTRAALGLVTGVFEFAAGEGLPDGRVFDKPVSWIEGYLVRSQRAVETYDTIKAFQGTERPIGFSVQGRALERDPRDPRTVTKSVVLEMAITRCPVWGQAYAIAGAPATNPISGGSPSRSVVKSSAAMTDEDREEFDLEPRGASKTPGSTVVSAGVRKGAAMDEEEKKKKEEEEKKKREEAMEKSIRELGEVVKSLSGFVQASSLGRRETLLAKGSNGGLTAEESVELARLLTPAPELPGRVHAAAQSHIVKSMDGGEYLDATPIIKDAFESVVKSVAEIGGFLEKSRTEERNFSAVMAKALLNTVRLVERNAQLTKSLSDKLDAFGRGAQTAPGAVYAVPPQGAQAPQAPQATAPVQVTPAQRAQTLDLMTTMLNKSRGEQEPVYDGKSLAESIIHYGSFGELTPGTARAVATFAQTGQIVRN